MLLFGKRGIVENRSLKKNIRKLIVGLWNCFSIHRGNEANEKAPVMFFSSADHVSNQSFTRDAAHTFNRLQQGESGEKSGPRQGGRRKRDGNVAAYHQAKSSKVVFYIFVANWKCGRRPRSRSRITQHLWNLRSLLKQLAVPCEMFPRLSCHIRLVQVQVPEWLGIKGTGSQRENSYFLTKMSSSKSNKTTTGFWASKMFLWWAIAIAIYPEVKVKTKWKNNNYR
jgi:hypothetical protein